MNNICLNRKINNNFQVSSLSSEACKYIATKPDGFKDSASVEMSGFPAWPFITNIW
jgi:hypothetical protein